MSPENIRSMVDPKIFERGVAYLLDGKVVDCFLKDGVLFGTVQGSSPLPYQVKIYFAGKRKPHSECTCASDWGDFCKHAVAVLLHVSRGEIKSPKIALAHKRKSLIFADTEIAPPPVLRLTLSARHQFTKLSQGIKLGIHVIQGQEVTVVRYPRAFFNAGADAKGDSLYPDINLFNANQQYLLRLLASFTKDTYNGFRIDAYELALLFKESAGKEGIEFFEGKDIPLSICLDKKVKATVSIAHKNQKQIHIFLKIQNPDHIEKLLEGVVITGHPCWVIDFENRQILPFADVLTAQVLTNSFKVNQYIELPRADFPTFLTSVLEPIKSQVALIYEDKGLEKVHITQVPPVIQLYLKGDTKALNIELKCVYATHIFDLKELINADEYMAIEGGWVKRDIPLERHTIHQLCNICGFQVDSDGFLFLYGTDKIINFVHHQLPRMAKTYAIFYEEGFKERFKSNPVLIPSIHLGGQGLDWFHFDARYRAEGADVEFSHEEIRKQLAKGRNYIQLKNGEIFPIAMDEFNKVEAMMGEFEGKDKKLAAFHSPFLIEEASRQGLKINYEESFRQLHERLKGFQDIKAVLAPEALRLVLRDYQQKGLDWLEFLQGFKFGGILADEMGLGKTLQVLALIKNQVDAGETRPNLVVCPTTLVFNWQAEVKKFAPDLKVIIPHGSERREQIGQIKEAHVVITSYALLRRDAPYYEKLSFNYMILDEAQNIKNRHTLNARMSKKIKSQHRLVMTGTPMENSIADLWSIFDFLMPGFLGSYERFKERFELPILRDGNKEVLIHLGRKIKPFMIRRLKKEVIKELPARIEQVSFCELEPTQYKCYEQMLAMARKEVVGAVTAKGFNKSRMKILTIILRLRQICCHPELAHVNLGHHLMVSAKLNLLKEILQEALSGGHKVLIFSQFIGMLEIISEYLKKEKIIFEYMDGSTQDRHETVDRFNNTESVKVFLLSLKVGGVGLNLTRADTVIIFEPWWNPAVEDQAIDRAHRIGQDKTVTAYKFISKGTIEEKILELQQRKKNIIDSLVVAEEGIAKKLDWQDIKFLLDIN